MDLLILYGLKVSFPQQVVKTQIILYQSWNVVIDEDTHACKTAK